MHYTCTLFIEKPLDRVIELFDNPDNMIHWQAGLQSYELLSGEPGQPGAKMALHYQMGKRKIDMVETIIENRLPEFFSGTYEARGVWNKIENEFEEVVPGRTKWVARNEFRFKGFMKIMALFMPRAFKKQSLQIMEAFKTFAESHD